jgi:hypothetical protein
VVVGCWLRPLVVDFDNGGAEAGDGGVVGVDLYDVGDVIEPAIAVRVEIPVELRADARHLRLGDP